MQHNEPRPMPINIFFCYAREDEVWLNKLKAHLISPCGEANRERE
ncbi:hypothetical protein KSD_59930 [Ktedonobacter sp. SOSP1-85]|nr:hypothetical protein KSD_59930 [Ktedonobacter sp. SOSP1-85]